MSTEVFDKQIADIRVVQILDKATKNPLSWVLEFRFHGEENWHPVKVQTYEIEQVVPDNEPTTGN